MKLTILFASAKTAIYVAVSYIIIDFAENDMGGISFMIMCVLVIFTCALDSLHGDDKGNITYRDN